MPEERRPVRRQARGLKRMAAILDAAEEVITEVGYAEATTNAIAARAGMSPGSLYQFFRNKEEILDGLLARFTTERRLFWDAYFTPDSVATPLPDLVGQVIDAAVSFKRAHPAYWSLLYGSATADRLAEASARLHQDVARRLAEVLALRAPHLPPERRLTLATMVLATVTAIMPRIVEAPPDRAEELTAELKTMLIAYLTPALTRPEPSP